MGRCRCYCPASRPVGDRQQQHGQIQGGQHGYCKHQRAPHSPAQCVGAQQHLHQRKQQQQSLRHEVWGLA